MNKHDSTLCVCVSGFMGWEQCSTGALSSCQAGVQEINVYYLGEKRNKLRTSPLICSISWCLLWLRASPPARPLTSAVPGSDAAPWSNPRELHYLLMRWHCQQWCKQPEPCEAFLPLHPPLACSSPCHAPLPLLRAPSIWLSPLPYSKSPITSHSMKSPEQKGMNCWLTHALW